MRKLRTGSIAAIAVLGLALGACGDDDDAPTDDTSAEETDSTAPVGETESTSGMSETTDTMSESTDGASEDTGGESGSAGADVQEMLVGMYTDMGMTEEQATCFIEAVGLDASSIDSMSDVNMSEMMSKGREAFSDCDINPADLSMGN